MNKDFIKMMTSYKGLYMRSFLECRDCGFVLTVLGQADYNMDGVCPSCSGFGLSYATEEAREGFIEGVKGEIESFEREIKLESDSDE